MVLGYVRRSDLMARLIVLSIRDKGDSVLIVTHCAGVTVMGFVAKTTLDDFFEHPPSMCECMMFVRANLERFEQILLRKSETGSCAEGTIACVEAIDLMMQGIATFR
jgi:hypothetical protein